MLVFTNFSAVMDIRARATLNCAVDGHAVWDNFVAVWNQRTVRVDKKTRNADVDVGKMTCDNIEIATVDVHHILAATINRGKKNNHTMHIVCLEALSKKYKTKFQNKNMELKSVFVRTDNVPTQYRCQHNFINVVSMKDRHESLLLAHFLAMKSNFKGPHDGYGKEAAALV